MAAISLRLHEDLDQRLAEESALVGRPRSEVVRDALVHYLAEQERKRITVDGIAAARVVASERGARAEALNRRGLLRCGD